MLLVQTLVTIQGASYVTWMVYWSGFVTRVCLFFLWFWVLNSSLHLIMVYLAIAIRRL